MLPKNELRRYVATHYIKNLAERVNAFLKSPTNTKKKGATGATKLK